MWKLPPRSFWAITGAIALVLSIFGPGARSGSAAYGNGLKTRSQPGAIVAQATGANTNGDCKYTKTGTATPTPPSPPLSNHKYTVDYFEHGSEVEMVLQAPRVIDTTTKVLLFQHGGGFTTFSDASVLDGMKAAIANDTNVNAMVAMPKQTPYAIGTDGSGGTPPPPPGTAAAYEYPLELGCAIGWLGQHGTEYGLTTGSPYILIAGYSSGAGVVASTMLASNQFLPPDASISDIHGVMTMSGAYDYKRAEDADRPFFEYYYLHGEPTSSPDTSPLVQGAPSPAVPISVPWIVEYEQCDADTHYGTAYELADNLIGGWNGGDTYVYENTVHYGSVPSPTASPIPTPIAGVAVHGDGEKALANPSSFPYTLLSTLIKTPNQLPTPRNTPTWEAVNFNSTVPGVTDVAYGPEGSLWVVSSKHTGDLTNYPVAKYSNKGQGNTCFDVPVMDSGAATRIAVDQAGDPWTVSASNSVATLTGGLIAAEPIYTASTDEGNGTGSTFSPVTGSATDVGAGGGSLSGSVSPTVYNNYTLPLGSIWITTTTPSTISPSDFTLKYYTSSGFVNHVLGYGQQIAVDSNGNAWLATNSGAVYTTQNQGTCTGGFCLVSGQTALDIGAGGSYSWITGPAPNYRLYHVTIPPAAGTWQYVSMNSGVKLSISLLGFPAVMQTDNSMYIYHSCWWPDGSPGDGSAPACPTLTP